jgi:phosphatidylglycerophosphate synthase
MTKYFKILKLISKQNNKIYNLTNQSFCQILFGKISYIFTPVFILLGISANIITLFNFIISILMGIFITIGNDYYFYTGISLYFLCRILDYSDGAVARYHNNSTFYGRYIDGLADIFLNSFLIFSISIYSYQIFNQLSLIIFGCLTAILTTFDSFIYDRYSALIRWSNEENNKKMLPYVKKKFLPNLPKIYNDIYTLLIFSLFFSQNENNLLFILFVSIFFTFSLSALQTFFVHQYFAYLNMNSNAKVKNSAKKTKKTKNKY